MSEQDRNLAEMGEGDLERHRRNQALIQEAIEEVTGSAAGRDHAAVRAALVRALSDRGIGEQPPQWLDAVAAEAVAGRRYVEDPDAGG